MCLNFENQNFQSWLQNHFFMKNLSASLAKGTVWTLPLCHEPKKKSELKNLVDLCGDHIVTHKSGCSSITNYLCLRIVHRSSCFSINSYLRPVFCTVWPCVGITVSDFVQNVIYFCNYRWCWCLVYFTYVPDVSFVRLVNFLVTISTRR